MHRVTEMEMRAGGTRMAGRLFGYIGTCRHDVIENICGILHTITLEPAARRGTHLLPTNALPLFSFPFSVSIMPAITALVPTKSSDPASADRPSNTSTEIQPREIFSSTHTP